MRTISCRPSCKKGCFHGHINYLTDKNDCTFSIILEWKHILTCDFRRFLTSLLILLAYFTSFRKSATYQIGLFSVQEMSWITATNEPKFLGIALTKIKYIFIFQSNASPFPHSVFDKSSFHKKDSFLEDFSTNSFLILLNLRFCLRTKSVIVAVLKLRSSSGYFRSFRIILWFLCSRFSQNFLFTNWFIVFYCFI